MQRETAYFCLSSRFGHPRRSVLGPRRKSDAADQFLRVERPDNAIVVKASWRDNPWFPSAFEGERQLDLQHYPDRYAHVWLGDYAKAFEGAYCRMTG